MSDTQHGNAFAHQMDELIKEIGMDASKDAINLATKKACDLVLDEAAKGMFDAPAINQDANAQVAAEVAHDPDIMQWQTVMDESGKWSPNKGVAAQAWRKALQSDDRLRDGYLACGKTTRNNTSTKPSGPP